MNGVDGLTGDDFFPPYAPDDLVPFARRELAERPPAIVAELHRRRELGEQAHLALADGFDAHRLAEAGWGVIFSPRSSSAARHGLEELLRRRRGEAGKLYREIEYRGGSKLDFLAAHGVGPGMVEPRQLPYYLLIVGSPNEIPFRLQCELGLQYAVGRLHFDGDRGYATYARGVLAAEDQAARPPRACLFGVRDDAVTERIHDRLLLPLAASLEKDRPIASELRKILGREARKGCLRRLLGGSSQPALLFAAAHGLAFRPPDARQRSWQGALVCRRDGPRASRYFGASSVGQETLLGTIAVLFACFSAGVPRVNHFARLGPRELPILSSSGAFVAALPQRLLGHPAGSALAVVGHVDRLWTYSFDWPAAGPQIRAFRDVLVRLLEGGRVGWAMEPLAQRCADLGSMLLATLDEPGESSDLLHPADLWTAYCDARNFAVLGDPAVRLVR